jgi:hypothetical protein
MDHYAMTNYQGASLGSGGNSSVRPDLFSAQRSPGKSSLWISEPKSIPGRQDGPVTAAPSYALPTNLPIALKHLANDQLDRLLAAVMAEQQVRGAKTIPVPDGPIKNAMMKKVAPPLAKGKLNAVRAAFKAGLTPSRIARQFGISQSEVRKALASNPS